MRKEYIFWFNVPMSITLLMHKMQSVHHLVEIGPADLFREFASLSDKIKEFSTSHIFKNNSKTIICSLILFFVDSVFSHTDQFYQILVVQLFHDVEFMLESFQSGCLFLVFLDGN